MGTLYRSYSAFKFVRVNQREKRFLPSKHLPHVDMSSGELSFMIWQPNQIPPPRATPIPNGTWNKYKDPIVEWHRNGRTQREIGILLEEKGLRCTYVFFHLRC